MLNGVYGDAFRAFLQLTNLVQPSSIDHPVVALFLLVCDMAINPSAGFPGPVIHHSTFVVDTDPGIRFVFLCRTIATGRMHLVDAIRTYSRSEYEAVSTELAIALRLDPPLQVLRDVCTWKNHSTGIKELMKGYEAFDFGSVNLLPRVLLAHFISFSEDKLRQPEYFCWPGAWMAGDRVSEDAIKLFDRHGALFVDKIDDDGIFARLRSGFSEAAIMRTYESFYSNVVTYDLTRQWIIAPGPFKYDYRWLAQHGSDAEIKSFADDNFIEIYGVHPDSVELTA